MKRAFETIGFLASLSILALGQTPAPPAFAAADVHVSPASANAFFDSGFLPGGRYQLHNATLVNLVAEAFEIDAESVSGGPPWIDTDLRHRRQAPPKSTQAERAAMLRSLLAERFKLVVHKDEKPLNVYVLSVGNRGAQLQESGGAGSTDCKPGNFDQGPPPMVSVTCPGMTMPRFARQLHRMGGGDLNHQIIDLTGLPGVYAITLRWSPPGAPKTNDADEPTGSSPFSTPWTSSSG